MSTWRMGSAGRVAITYPGPERSAPADTDRSRALLQREAVVMLNRPSRTKRPEAITSQGWTATSPPMAATSNDVASGPPSESIPYTAVTFPGCAATRWISAWAGEEKRANPAAKKNEPTAAIAGTDV